MNRYHFDEENHIHFLDDKPLCGTSSVVGVLSKPLTWWASGLAVEKFGWKNPKITDDEERIASVKEGYEKIKSLSLEEFDKLLDEAYRAHSVKLDDSAQKGTDLHAELERFVKYKMNPADATVFEVKDERIKLFIDWTNANVKRFLLSEAHMYSERLWLGGITDCVAELNDGTVGIIDFKSSKESYLSQFVQGGGYSIQLKENGAFDKDGNLIYKLDKNIDWIAIVPFGRKKFSVDFNKVSVAELEKGFEDCLSLYKLTLKEKK